MPAIKKCYVDSILELVGDRWTLAILHQMTAEPRRTQHLLDAFRGLSTKTLSARLKTLEKAGVIARKSYRESPPRVEYSLTEHGATLLPLISAFAEASLNAGLTGDTHDEIDICPVCAEMLGGGADKISQAAPAAEPPSAPAISRRKKKPFDVTLL